MTKLIVADPRPLDVETFEKVYLGEHVPLAIAKLTGKTKIVGTKVRGSPLGTPPFYRIAEIYFPSMKPLKHARLSAEERRHSIMPPRFRQAESPSS